MSAGLQSEAERRMPPAARSTVELFRSRGHSVSVRQNRNGSLRYRLDGGKEKTASQLSAIYRLRYEM